MNWQVTSITWVYLLISFITMQIGMTIYFRKAITGRLPFFYTMLMLSQWTLAAAIESAVTTIQAKILLSQIEYVGALTAPVFFLKYIISYMGDGGAGLRKYFAYFWVIPIAVIFLAWLNPHFNLVWVDFTWSPYGENILKYHHGPAYYVVAVYSVLLILLGNIILIHLIFRKPVLYARKAWYLLPGSLFPVFTVILYLAKVNPIEGLDISPMGIMFSGVIFLAGIIRDELFDVVPVAHRVMIEKMPDGVVVLTRNFFIVDMNPSFCASFNIQSKSVGHEFLTEFPALAERVVASDPLKDDRFEFLYETGGRRWYDVIKTNLVDSRQNKLGILLILRDITHRKNNELTLKKVSEDLHELNTMKDKLFSIISHDLRSPFNSILGFTNLMIDSYDEATDDERKHFARQIRNAATSSFRLLENLLIWSNIQRGRVVFQPETISLSLLVNEVFNIVRPAAIEKGIIIINQVPPDLSILADANMIGTVIRNLVSNSIKFSSRGGFIRVTSTLEPGIVNIHVADNGVGMSEEAIGKLFRIETMFSTTGTGNEKGTGLGLILCHEFVNKHQGKISIKSEPGMGSMFTVSLPLT